jgi:dolichyl-phosphate-mannose--protein O-mannosyl transferase
MHVAQSRLIMVDAILVFFTCFSLIAAVRLWDAREASADRRATPAGRSLADVSHVAFLLVATGLLCGWAVAVRWTAFATPILVLAVSMFGIPPFCQSPLSILEVVVLAASMCASYFLSFAVYLGALSKSGAGDAFMSPEFQACLAGSDAAAAANGICKRSLFRRIVELNRTIYSYSKNIRGTDRSGSTWFQWIVNWRGTLYYRSAGPAAADSSAEAETHAIIYVFMNPAMIVVLKTLMAVFLCLLCYRIRYRSVARVPTPASKIEALQLRRGVVLLFGWMASMLPTMVVYRSGPCYQYMCSLLFAQVLGALSFDIVIPSRARSVTVVLCTAVMAVAFAYWAPWVYGLQLTAAQHNARRWMPSWI